VKVKRRDYQQSGAYTVVDQGEGKIAGYVDDDALLCDVSLPVIGFGDHTRRFKFIEFPFVAGADGLKLIAPDRALNPKWMYWALQDASFEDRGYSRHFQFVRRLSFAVPPREEQDRIVSRLESLLDLISAAGDDISSAESLLDALSNRVLDEATYGDWPKHALEDFIERLTSGSRDWKLHYGQGLGRFLLAQTVRPLRLDLDAAIAVDPPSDDPACERSAVRKDDVLVTIVGAGTGTVARVPTDLQEHYVCQSVALIRPKPPLIGQFLEIYLAAPSGGQRDFARLMYGQGRPHLGFADLKKLSIPVPEPEVQEKVIANVEARLGELEDLRNVVREAALTQQTLKGGIVRAALRGDLSERNPRDTPASELLKTIAAGRRTNGKKSRTLMPVRSS
jgi:hypothetical protein